MNQELKSFLLKAADEFQELAQINYMSQKGLKFIRLELQARTLYKAIKNENQN